MGEASFFSLLRICLIRFKLNVGCLLYSGTLKLKLKTTSRSLKKKSRSLKKKKKKVAHAWQRPKSFYQKGLKKE